MKIILIEMEKKKLQNKLNFLENNRVITQNVFKMQEIYLLPKYIKLISRDAFSYANPGL
jgi:hypothetical protein